MVRKGCFSVSRAAAGTALVFRHKSGSDSSQIGAHGKVYILELHSYITYYYIYDDDTDDDGRTHSTSRSPRVIVGDMIGPKELCADAYSQQKTNLAAR